MSYLEELLPEFKRGAKIRRKDWREKKYIKLCGLYAKDEYGDSYFLEPNELAADDWDYIINNKCLCQFWDNEESKKSIGILAVVAEDEYMPFLLYGGEYFRNCRPVRRDEVTFYEERKDKI